MNSPKSIYIKKANGELELFSSDKLANSLRRAGASESLIREIIVNIENWISSGVTTKKIYGRAFSLLRKKERSRAARYSLKNAIMELGPTGYPFENFVGKLFEAKGYQVEVGQVLQGKCVTHEVDVVATKGNEMHFIECKYYNSQGKYASVQVPLYIRSRVNDIIDAKVAEGLTDYNFYGWIATNTRFTEDATSFGLCSGLKLISWSFPEELSLKKIVEENNLFPITTLTELSTSQKEQLLARGVVMCKELHENSELFKFITIKSKQLARVKREIADLLE